MKIKLFGRTLLEISNSVESLPPVGNDEAWREYLSAQGYNVNALTAIRVAAVFRCVDIISKTMASLPLHMYVESDAGKEKAKAHALYNRVYVLPNANTTAYEFWQMYVANLLLTRGAFAKIKRDGAGRIIALWNIPTANASDIYINKENGERYIIVTQEGKQETLRDGDFMYTPAFRLSDDKDPESPMKIASEVLGLTHQANAYAAKGFESVNPGGFIEYPNGLSQEAYERFKMDFEKNYSGTINAGKWLFLEEGGKANPFTRDMEKSQVLESRKWAVTEVCRLFGVPPHLCMDMEHATFSNIEHQSLEFVRDCISPMSVRLEQTMFKDLLTDKEKNAYYFKFNVNGLLRGDTAARTQYYHCARQDGWMNGDEIRAFEDMNEMPDGQGKIYMVNGNMIPVNAVPQNLPKGAKQK